MAGLWPDKVATELKKARAGSVFSSFNLSRLVSFFYGYSESSRRIHQTEIHESLKKALSIYGNSGHFIAHVIPWMANLVLHVNDHPIDFSCAHGSRRYFGMDIVRRRITRNTCKQCCKQFSITKEAIVTLLAVSFFCLCPRINNLDKLYRLSTRRQTTRLHKLVCFIHFFTKSFHNRGHLRRIVKLEHTVLPQGAQFWMQDYTLCKLEVVDKGSIEDCEYDSWKVDFANKTIGGGVLGTGCVQEEILFSIHPELIVSMFLCPVMADNEAIKIIGADRFSKYEGYGDTFVWAGDHQATFRSRVESHFVAMDAMEWAGEDQYCPSSVVRELRKAFVAFSFSELEASRNLGIATGNWGCGAFGGDVKLKSMIQWIAASAANRPFLRYFSYEHPEIQGLREIVECLQVRDVTVSQLFTAVESHCKIRIGAGNSPCLFEYLKSCFNRCRHLELKQTLTALELGFKPNSFLIHCLHFQGQDHSVHICFLQNQSSGQVMLHVHSEEKLLSQSFLTNSLPWDNTTASISELFRMVKSHLSSLPVQLSGLRLVFDCQNSQENELTYCFLSEVGQWLAIERKQCILANKSNALTGRTVLEYDICDLEQGNILTGPS